MIRPTLLKYMLTLIQLSSIIQQRELFTESRAIMVEPPHRSSLWRFNYNTTMNLRDDNLNCGGYDWQWGVNEGRCGVCGDLWNGTQDNADRGRYDSGIIVRKYIDGHYINITFEVSSNYLGYVEFKLCPRNSTDQVLEQSCFDRYPLWIDESHGTRYYIGSRGGIYDIHIRLSSGLVCKKCVLQWKYKTGYRYNGDETCKCLGCGKQEQYINCADIEIAPANGWPRETTPPTTIGRKKQTTVTGTLDGVVSPGIVDQIQNTAIGTADTVFSLERVNNQTRHITHVDVDVQSARDNNATLNSSSVSPILSNITKSLSNFSANNSIDNQQIPGTDILQNYVTPLTPTNTSPQTLPGTTPKTFISRSRQTLTLEDLRKSIIGSEVKSGSTIFFSPPKVSSVTNTPLVGTNVQGGRFQVPKRSTVANTHFPSVSNILNRFYMTPFLFPGSNINLPPGCDVFSDEFRCKARGIYNQSPGISKWCEINCRASNCVSFMCECSCEDKMKNQTSKCHAIADFHGVEGMDLWCVANCKVGFCPANTCSVEDCIKLNNVEV